MTIQTTAIDPTQLPEVISVYLEAHRARDIDRAVSSYRADATVIDDGRTYHGRDAIRDWLSRSASEFTYTIEMTGATKLDRDSYEVAHHLEGDFPGGQVDLIYRFSLVDGAIAELVIEQH